MPDKDFEQQIREGLGDWEMVPPPPVRQAVLDSVRQRRRRRAILWIPSALLLLGLLAGGMWYALRVGPVGPGEQGATGAAAPAPAGAKASAPVGPTAGAAAPVMTPSGASPSAPAGANRATGTGVAAVTPSSGTSAGAAPAGTDHAAGPATAAKGHRANSRGARAAAETGALTPDLKAGTGLAIVPLPDNWWGSAAAFPVRPAVLQTEASRARTDMADKKGPGKKAAVLPPGSKWSFRVSASAGVSGQGSFFQFSAPAKTIYTRFYTFPASSMNASSPTSGGGGTAPTSGYDTLAGRKTGAGWTLGVAIERRLSTHFRAGAGVDYARFDTRIGPVSGGGTAPGALTSAYSPSASYSGGPGFTYVNRYTLLRVPLDLTWMIAPVRRWNPSVYGGVSGAFLFSGNALMYEPNVSGYTKSSLLYRHWSLYGELGFSMDLVHAGWFVLQAGPVVQYGISGLEKPAPVKDHLNYAGIRLDMMLPVKVNKQKP